MRIIAGEHRGQRIAAPKGEGTRPTTDRVRESLMSMVASAAGGFEGLVVLDAFAGSGALALEALSRGAARATLCDSDPGALGVVRANAESLRYGPGQARVLRRDVLAKGLPAAGAPFDLVFLDPPYAVGAEQALGLLARAAGEGLLAPGVLASYEHGAAGSAAVDACLGALGLRLLRRRAFGDTVVDLIEREDG